MGKLYVCVRNFGKESLLTINKSYLGYPSFFTRGWIHIIHCDDGQPHDIHARFFELVEEYD